VTTFAFDAGSDPEYDRASGLLGDTLSTFRRWLHLPDPGGLYVALGTVVANRSPGDPLWSFLVAPPSSGKTEILNALTGLPDCHGCSQLTEGGLLSGSPQRRSGATTGGLLRVIGKFGIVVLKDFGSVLAMPADKRGQLLAGLREVYDGYWRRDLGSLGGIMLDWEGKIGMVAGVTESIDSHYHLIGAMGDRWVLYRLPDVGRERQVAMAMSKSGHEGEMRDALREGCTEVIERASSFDQYVGTEGELDRVGKLAMLATLGRSAVERDGYQRDIVNVHRPEGPARFAKSLLALLDGLTRIGVEEDERWRIIGKATCDSMPKLRWSVISLLGRASASSVDEVADAVRYPPTTTRRALEDLAVLGVVERLRATGNMPDRWTLALPVRRSLDCLPAPTGDAPTGDGESVSRALPHPFTPKRTPNTQERGSREVHSGDAPKGDTAGGKADSW
jgi:hypothetical protein